MRIVEALILAPSQGQDQLLLGNRNRPRHAASAIAMLHPAQGIGLIAPFQPLHLTLAQMQQAGGFAYAQPPARCIFNHLHPLELFLTHGHHPLEGVRISLQLRGDIILEHLQSNLLCLTSVLPLISNPEVLSSQGEGHQCEFLSWVWELWGMPWPRTWSRRDMK